MSGYKTADDAYAEIANIKAWCAKRTHEAIEKLTGERGKGNIEGMARLSALIGEERIVEATLDRQKLNKMLQLIKRIEEKGL